MTQAVTTPDSAIQITPDKKTRRNVIFASTIGTTIEFYDFYIYATAAVLVFPVLFFTDDDPTNGLLKSFATFGLAFVARPLGSVIFGHFGDKIGRKATLIGSLLTMGIATFLIGLLPTFSSIGVWASLLLATMRFCQGLGLGGEWSGAALLATENAEPGKRGMAAMWPQLGAPFGFILANGVFLILISLLGANSPDAITHSDAFLQWGWRVPFLLSGILVLFGLYVRVSLEETPVFKNTVEKGEKTETPLTEVFKTSWRPLILGTLVMISSYTIFYLVSTWTLSYATADKATRGYGLDMDYVLFLRIQLVAILLFVAAVPAAGYLCDKFGRKRVVIVNSIGMILYGLGFGYLLNADGLTGTELDWKIFIFLAIGFILIGFSFGPMAAILPEMFPTNVRYTGSGIAYNLASILGAAVAPFIATLLVQSSGGAASVGMYLAIVSAVSLVAMIIMRETKDDDLTKTSGSIREL